MISIIIPTYNEEKVIAKAIYSALNQISKKDEIIVVASGCTDKTVEKIKEIKDKRIKLIIEKERKGKSSAINLAIKKAKSEIIVQFDGDVVVNSGAIKYLIKHFKNPKIGAVSGNPQPVIPPDNLFYNWTQMSYRKIGEIREKESREGTFWHLSGYLLAFRKKALKKLPFIKGAVDALMGMTIKDNGYKIIYEPEAKVFVKCPTNCHDFVIQKARVRAGYSYLPKSPRTIGGEIFYLPKEMLKIPISQLPKFIFCGFVYLYSWCLGYYYKIKNKSLQEVWQTPESTKR